ncbi:hypothetical protein AAC387_Pa04g0691 [Persea americana]
MAPYLQRPTSSILSPDTSPPPPPTDTPQLGTPVSVAEVLNILQTEPFSFAPSSSHLSTVHIQKLSALIHQQGLAGLES